MDTQYFESREGQILLRRARMRRAVLLIIHDQEPKSKKSISKREKQLFQETVVSEMKSRNRRAFRSDIVLEISFSCRESNPPLIHTLAKNYLDLLSRPVPGSGISRKNILYKDDNQVKTLIVNYTIGSPDSLPSVVIRALPLRDFLAEFELLGRIQRDDFIEKDFRYEWRYNGSWNRLYGSVGYDVGGAKSLLQDIKATKAERLERMGEKCHEEMLSCAQSYLQQCILRASQLNLHRCLLLFSTHCGRLGDAAASSNRMKDLGELARDIVVGRLFSVDLKEWPRKSGQSSAFKARIDSELNSFKRTFPHLIKLKTLLSLTILFVAPRGGQVDADNIARIIVPKVNSVFEPPSRLLIRSEDKKQREILRIPEHSIVRYEVIELPRSKNDPDEGFVRLIFGDGLGNSGIWSDMESVIRDWVESVESGNS